MDKTGISKNGITNDIKQLVKALRKNKRITGGENWWSSNKSNHAITSNLTNAKNIEKAIAVAKGVTGAIVAIELISNVAEPLLAASGVGIPLLAILIIAKKLAKQYKQNLQLNVVLSDVIVIIENSFFLEALIKKTMTEFYKPVQNALIMEIEKNNSTQEAESLDNQQPSNNDKKNFVKTNNIIEDKIKQKLYDLNRLLQKISPQDNETRLAVFKQKFKRFFFSGELKNEIITNLSIINGLFTIYNSQFDWSIRYYESKILNYTDNGKDELKNIWKKIENSDEYNKYLFQNDENMNNIINDAKKDPKTMSALGEVIEKAGQIEESNQPQLNQPEEHQPQPDQQPGEEYKNGGNKKSYKKKCKNKKRRLTIKINK